MTTRQILALATLTPFTGAVVHYPPTASSINSLDFVLHGSGTNGIYNSSATSISDYGLYNYCNMPHTRSREYVVPEPHFELAYVEVVQRHHKRTPYSSNTFPKEDITWDCSDVDNIIYARPTATIPVAAIKWKNYKDSLNPFSNTGINGSCQFPQITFEGLQDSWQHGQDLRSVYIDQLQFLPEDLDPKLIQFKVTSNTITSQVAGALIEGMFPLSSEYAVLQEMDSSDSLRPGFPCPAADTIRDTYQGTNTNWTQHLDAAQPLFARLDAVSQISPSDRGWHSWFDHYFDNFSSKQCHQKSLPCLGSACISQADADTVYRLGQYEYSYIYRDAPQSALYSSLRYGAFFVLLKEHLLAKVNGLDPILYRHGLAHDGSIAPLLGALQISEMVWPGLGSEVIFELWKDCASPLLGMQQYVVRVLWGGRVMKTSTPRGFLDMVPLQEFLDYVTSLVGTNSSDLVTRCTN